MSTIFFLSFWFSVIASQQSFLLRASGVGLDPKATGPFPEITISTNGVVLTSGLSGVSPRPVARIGTHRMNWIRRQIARVPEGTDHVRRWFSGAFCQITPKHKLRFEADGGRIFLGMGDVCLGGGIENINSQELIHFLRSIIPK